MGSPRELGLRRALPCRARRSPDTSAPRRPPDRRTPADRVVFRGADRGGTHGSRVRFGGATAMAGVVVVGNGGHARSCMDAWDPASDLKPAGYVGPATGDVLGLPYLGSDDDLAALFASGLSHTFVALGSNAERQS